MDITVTHAGTATVVAPAGDLDMAVAPELSQALKDLIDQGRRQLVLDLGRVDYVDSAGLGALVASIKRARGAGGDIRLCALQPDVRSVFDMTRLMKVIDVFPSRDDALASWGCR